MKQLTLYTIGFSVLSLFQTRKHFFFLANISVALFRGNAMDKKNNGCVSVGLLSQRSKFKKSEI